MTVIAFIGLGNMGGPMLRNLIRAGHAVRAFDLSAAALQAAADAGAVRTASPAEAAREAEAVITMLPAGAHVREVLTGAGGVMAAAKPATLLIDCSTIDVETARALAEEAGRRGLLMIDAPVSGGVGGAAAGTLTFMAGGSEGAFGRAKPILSAMGKNIFHAGGSGAGQAAKVCNNMILAVSMIGTCEAFVLAEKLGLDAQKLFEIASVSSGQSWSLTSYCPVPGPVPASPANRGYAAGFSAAMMLKDLKLAQGAAQASGAATPLGAQAAQLYALYAGSGQEARDFSGIISMLRGQG